MEISVTYNFAYFKVSVRGGLDVHNMIELTSQL